jgi:threonylcarbamoyladenosine tRNA methylthiotransferase CDKAL1
MQIFVRTFGCSANIADSEALAGCLRQAGYVIASTEQQADLLIYNTCAVKGPTENRIISALKQVPPNKKTIVAGCLPLISFERLQREVRFNAAIGPALGKKIVQVVKRVLEGETVIDIKGSLALKPQLDLPHIQTSPVISIVPINYGCLGSCTYCCVVHARGHLRSCTEKEIVARVKADVLAGAKEIWLTSQDTACYGRDLGGNLASLLTSVALVEGEFFVRVGMMTPNFVVPFLNDLIKAFANPKVFKFLHLPVQSGDDEVLSRMSRFYTVEQFKAIVDAFRKALPPVTISTDVIVGFPGETDRAHQNTMKLLKEVKPDIVNVSKFFARPKTAAWNMQDEAVDKVEIKHRSAEAAALAREISLQRNQLWAGWSGEILIDEQGKIEGSWVGRNFAYKPIAVQSRCDLLGKRIQVKVKRAFSTHLTAELLN